jgi:hypothetical protein
MSVVNEIRASLETIGFEQQLCVFAFLSSYPLSLGGLLEGRGRRAAGLVSIASAAVFVVLTDPWMHGVLLVVALMASVGAFIVIVYALEQMHRLASRDALVPQPVEPDVMMHASGAEHERRRKLPLRGSAGTT